MGAIIKLRGGTAAQWAAANPVLAERELGLITDNAAWVVGDGVNEYVSLPAWGLGNFVPLNPPVEVIYSNTPSRTLKMGAGDYAAIPATAAAVVLRVQYNAGSGGLTIYPGNTDSNNIKIAQCGRGAFAEEATVITLVSGECFIVPGNITNTVTIVISGYMRGGV